MGEYISREAVVLYLKRYSEKEWDSSSLYGMMTSSVLHKAERAMLELPAADVQPLSVVAEHIKKRLYETAFNTTAGKARNAIADMAGRIDFWIDELKGGDTNG